MDMRALLGRNLTRLRNKAGHTQEVLAELSGIAQPTISQIEGGKVNATILTIYGLAQALGVSHIDLLEPDSTALHEIAKANQRLSGKK